MPIKRPTRSPVTPQRRQLWQTARRNGRGSGKDVVITTGTRRKASPRTKAGSLISRPPAT
jgi:hypothetical protein